MQLQVNMIHDYRTSGGVSKRNGQPYTVHAWLCDGVIDGQPAYNIALETLSGTVASSIQAGWLGYVEADTHSGQLKYKIPTPRQDAPQPHARAQGGYSQPSHPAMASAGSYALPELEALMRHALDFAAETRPDWGDSAQQAMAATFVIAAQKCGIKIVPPGVPMGTLPPHVNQPAQAAMQPGQQAPYQSALLGAGLHIAVGQAGITADTLSQWWDEASGNAQMFAMRVRAELQYMGR